jgi:hypothetical protein
LECLNERTKGLDGDEKQIPKQKLDSKLPWWLTWIDGRAILFAGLLIWALRKALISGDNHDQR